MRKIAVAVFALLLFASPAAAKMAMATKACGVDGCRAIDRALTDRLMAWGMEASREPRDAPFYRVRFATRGPEGERAPGFSIVWIPRTHLLLQEAPLGNTTWFREGRARRALRSVTAGLTPYPGALLERLDGKAELRTKRAAPRLATERARSSSLLGDLAAPAKSPQRPAAERTAEGSPLVAGAGVLALVAFAGVGLTLRRRRAS